jgi:hypothetical protein
MVPFVLLGLAVWIAVSVPIALLFVRILNLEEGQDAPASVPGDVELECMDLALPVGAGLHRSRGADQVAWAGKRARPQAPAHVDRG